MIITAKRILKISSLIPMFLLPVFSHSAINLSKETGEVENPHGGALVIVRTSSETQIPRIDIISNVIKNNYPLTYRFRFSDSLPWNLSEFSSSENRFGQFSSSGSFDKYMAEAMGKQFLQQNADYLLRQFSKEDDYIAFFEVDSYWNDDVNLHQIKLCFVLVDRQLNISYISHYMDSVEQKVFDDKVKKDYAKKISEVLVREMSKLGFGE